MPSHPFHSHTDFPSPLFLATSLCLAGSSLFGISRRAAATLEFVPNEDRVSPPMPAAFALTMLASTTAGDAYTFKDLAEMHRKAGFGEATAQPIPNSPHTLVIAKA